MILSMVCDCCWLFRFGRWLIQRCFGCLDSQVFCLFRLVEVLWVGFGLLGRLSGLVLVGGGGCLWLVLFMVSSMYSFRLGFCLLIVVLLGVCFVARLCC